MKTGHFFRCALAGLLAISALAWAAEPAATAAPLDARANVVALVTRAIETWQTGDAPAFLAAFADDATFAFPGGRAQKAELAALFADLQSRKRDIKVYIGPFIVLGNEFALRYQFACTDRATGKRQAVGTGVRGVLREGKIVTFKEYWDAHIPLEQAAGKLPLDEGNPLFPAPASHLMPPDRIN